MESKSKAIVLIDPMVNINYASFYIQGLHDVFGAQNVRFSSEPFIGLENRGITLNFVVKEGSGVKKYTIDFNDFCTVKEKVYDWCDAYGHVNANFAQIPERFHPKLISLVPSFGVRLWNVPETTCRACINAVKAKGGGNLRKFLGKYKKQLTDRVPYDEYIHHDLASEKEYIFHISTLWYNDEWNKNDENVNLVRYRFIKACQSLSGVRFEGGLAASPESARNPKFADAIFSGRLSVNEYIKKTKRSAVVFNTPAFWNCHGWKLGEYMALGKAIISTSLYNDLPFPLEHGKNIHFVDNDENEMKKAVSLLLNDPLYRKKLEDGANT